MNTTPPTSLARIVYPPPPWVQHGSVLGATFLVRAGAVADSVPAPLQVLRMVGGFAIGFLAVSRYLAGSTRVYSELIAGVVVRYGSHTHPYITHTGVDDLIAQRAGREVWHLPRQFWNFSWEFDDLETRVQVWDRARLICSISKVPPDAALFPVRPKSTFLTLHANRVALIHGSYTLRATATAWKLHQGIDGPLQQLQPAGPLATFVGKGVASVEAPEPLPADEQPTLDPTSPTDQAAEL